MENHLGANAYCLMTTCYAQKSGSKTQPLHLIFLVKVSWLIYVHMFSVLLCVRASLCTSMFYMGNLECYLHAISFQLLIVVSFHREEADELCRTLEENEDKARTASEMADVLYHAMVLLAKRDVKVEDVLHVLRLRFSQSGIEEKRSR